MAQPGGNGDILEDDIFNGAFIPQLQGNAPVAVVNHAVFNDDIAEKILAFAAEFDGSAGGGHGAAGHRDIFTGAVVHGGQGVFEHDAVIGAFQVAVGDPHILTVIRINAVAIGHAHIVQDPDALDQHIPAAHHMHRPECALFQRHIPDGQMIYIFQKQHGGAGVEKSLNMPGIFLTVENFLVAVDPAQAGDGQVFTISGIQKIMGGRAGVFAVDIAGHIPLFGGGFAAEQ